VGGGCCLQRRLPHACGGGWHPRLGTAGARPAACAGCDPVGTCGSSLRAPCQRVNGQREIGSVQEPTRRRLPCD
jgi:hypothetical protein